MTQKPIVIMSITKQIILTPPENFSFRNYLFLLCCEATATSRYDDLTRVQAIKVFRLAVWPQIKSFLPLARSRRLVKSTIFDCACERINTKK